MKKILITTIVVIFIYLFGYTNFYDCKLEGGPAMQCIAEQFINN